MDNDPSRRDFLAMSGLAAAGSLLAGGPAAAAAAATSAAESPAADDWIRQGYYACALQTFNDAVHPDQNRAAALEPDGAEVFLHCTSEVFTLTPSQKKIARAARAMENLAYLVSANTAGTSGIEVPAQSPDGGSEIIDYMGSVMVTTGQGESINAHGRLLLDGLRSYRRRPGMGNMLSRQALDLFAESFAGADLRRRNGLLQGGKVVVPDRSYFRERQLDTIARMTARGVIA